MIDVAQETCVVTRGLRIRPFAVTDGGAVVSILSCLDVSRWLAPVPHPFTHDDLRLMREDGSSKWPDLAAVTISGRVIGGVAMGETLGYYLAPAMWGQGLGREAAAAAVAQRFSTPEAEVMETGCFTDNMGSIRILSGLGFRETGRTQTRCAALGIDRPSIAWRLTRAEWERAS